MAARASAARAAVGPFVVSRVLVLVTLVMTRHVFTSLHLAVPLQARAGLRAWDAGWYRDIARGGYDAVAREGLRFFPLFPLLGRAVAWLPGIDAELGIVVVANVSAFVGGIALYHLAIGERADDALARRSVWLLYLAPPAFVLVLGYAEATFIVFAVVTLAALRRRRWTLAALAGAAAGLTRPVGVLLFVPALVEVVQAWRGARSVASRDARVGATLAVAGPIVGTGAYLVWARSRTHQLLYPLRVQQDPTRRGGFVDPVRGVAHAVHALFSGDHLSAGVHAGTALLLAALLVVLARRWPLSFTLYAAAVLVVALSSRNLDSLERYALSTVPFLLAAADVASSETADRLLFALSGAGLVAAAVLAFTGVLVP